jgi:hypothetical protein
MSYLRCMAQRTLSQSGASEQCFFNSVLEMLTRRHFFANFGTYWIQQGLGSGDLRLAEN